MWVETRVARERRPVDHQHPVALAGEQHRGGCAGAAGADDDRVVVVAMVGVLRLVGDRRMRRDRSGRIGEVPYSAPGLARAA